MLKPTRQLAAAAFILSAALLFGSRPASAQAKDPLAGNWVLNFGKSDFGNVPAPTNKTITIAAVDNGFDQTVKIQNANGAWDEMQFTAKYDGKEYPMPTASPLSAITLKKVDANTIEQVGIIRKKPAETVTYKLSGGGKVLTITTVGIDDHTNDYTQVYDKK
jgi:hypothetical protein